MELEFDKVFKITTISLNIIRSHPYIRKDKKWFLQFFIVHGIFTSVFILVIHNIIYHDLKLNNFSQACKNGIFCIVYIVVTFLYFVLLWHQVLLLELIENVNRDYQEFKYLSLDEREMVFKYVNQGVWVCKQWLVVTYLGWGVFVMKSITLMVYYYWIDEFKLIPLYDLVYPAIIEDNKDNILVYLFTYFLLLMYECYSATIYVAFVPLGPIFMMHACGQLELVEKQINNLFVERDYDVIKEKFKIIIRRLQYVYSFVDLIKQCFRMSYELTLKGSTILLPVTSYALLEALSRGEFSSELLVFLIGGTLISSSPCYYSELLMQKGEDIRLALYTCGWEAYYDRRTRTTLLLMLQYALRPIVIRSIFKTMCLEALTDLFQQSYAIFNVMNAMWN